jgi:hypothetical protein
MTGLSTLGLRTLSLTSQPRGGGGAAPPAETFDFLTEDGNALDAETGDNLITEEAP